MTRFTAADNVLSWRVQPSWLGQVLVAWSTQGVRAILMADNDEAALAELQACFTGAQRLTQQVGPHPWVSAVLELIDQPMRHQAHDVSLPLDVGGTPFQQSVWAALRQIPPGQTVSYSELAQRLGQPRAVRAVASACAANALAVAIPCHRVVRRDGSPSGYRWGLVRKQALLAREAAA
jgi:AraC family transcriptional regulator of adaptative response/methylated-DNA-[protein]-cysteine methyltransferase